METKYVRVPFDIELAKEITNGTKEGRIVTRGGKNARIVCFDAKNDFNIITLLTNENGEEFSFSYNNYGGDRMPEQNDDDLMLEIPEYMTFKDGDVYKAGNGSIGIYCSANKTIDNIVSYCVGLRSYDNKLCFYNEKIQDGFGTTKECTLDVTEEEKQKLIDALKQSYDPRAKECLKKLGIEDKKEYEFTFKQDVLVRQNNKDLWCGAQFSHKELNHYVVFGGSYFLQCIPYNEETEGLIGTTKSYNSK